MDLAVKIISFQIFRDFSIRWIYCVNWHVRSASRVYITSAFPLVKLDTVCITTGTGLKVNLTCYLGDNLILASNLCCNYLI